MSVHSCITKRELTMPPAWSPDTSHHNPSPPQCSYISLCHGARRHTVLSCTTACPLLCLIDSHMFQNMHRCVLCLLICLAMMVDEFGRQVGLQRRVYMRMLESTHCQLHITINEPDSKTTDWHLISHRRTIPHTIARPAPINKHQQ
jgi:hypothetical protein